MDILKKLLTVKSLTTLSMAGAFAYLAVKGIITGEQFLTVFTTVIAFYFGVQTSKGEE